MIVNHQSPPALSDLSLRTRDLGNRYFFFRHGKARSNEEQRLCGSLETDAGRDDLTPAGRAAVAACAEHFLDAFPLLSEDPARLRLAASGLTRARQSAEIMAEVIERRTGVRPPVEIHAALQERCYGELEGQPVQRWREVREQDRFNPFKPPFGGESQHGLTSRIRAFLLENEERHSGRFVVAWSHCDPIQAALSLFADPWPAHYSQMEELKTASWREARPAGRA